MANTRGNPVRDAPVPGEEQGEERNDDVSSEEEHDVVVEIADILENYGIVNANERDLIEEKLFPIGIDGLVNESAERIRGFFRDLRKRENIDADRRLIDVVIALMHMVKELKKLGYEDTLTFDNVESIDEFVEVVTERHMHDNPKETYERSKASDFSLSVQLESQDDWERWNMELMNQLHGQCNRNGVPYIYGIRDNDDPIIPEGQDCLLEQEEFPELLANAAVLGGIEWKADNQLLRNIIAGSITNPSDAYTLAKTVLKTNDGRKIYKFLQASYDNDAVRKARVVNAEREWENISFKGSHEQVWETFVSKSTQLLLDLDTLKRPVHPGKAIEMLFDKVQCPKLQGYKEQIYLKYQDREYGPPSLIEKPGVFTPMNLLQKLGFQLQRNASKPKGFNGRSVSEVGTGSGANWTRDGTTPEMGPFGPDGKLYIGNYPVNKWKDASMADYREQIKELRKKHPGPGSKKGSNKRGGGGKSNQYKKANRKISKLQKELKAMTRKLAAVKRSAPDESTDDDASSSSEVGPTGQNGNRFGGRAGKKARKGEKK